MNTEQSRFGVRKKKKMNHFLNIAIVVAGVLIFFLVYQLFFHSSESVVSDELELDEVEEVEDVTEQEKNDTSQRPVEDEIEEVEDNREEEEVEEVEGQWKPIGTVQPEPFEAVYDRDHVNWEEMTRALQYATKIADDIIIWRIENGGSPQSAVGVVSTSENQNTPYQVRLEWVPEKGWLPIEVDELSENPYLQ